MIHNPRNLPSPGEPPWRFILTSELECLPKDAQVWNNVDEVWQPTVRAGMKANFKMFTYRTQEPLPK